MAVDSGSGNSLLYTTQSYEIFQMISYTQSILKITHQIKITLNKDKRLSVSVIEFNIRFHKKIINPMLKTATKLCLAEVR